MGTYLNIKYKSLICLTPRMTLEMNPRIRCWTSRGRYGSGPDSADNFFGVWCENMVSAFSNACEFLAFPFVAFPYGSHMPLSRGGPCLWEQTPNLPGNCVNQSEHWWCAKSKTRTCLPTPVQCGSGGGCIQCVCHLGIDQHPPTLLFTLIFIPRHHDLL